MLDKLKTITDRYEALTSQLEDPATYADPDLLRRLFDKNECAYYETIVQSHKRCLV